MAMLKYCLYADLEYASDDPLVLTVVRANFEVLTLRHS